LAVSVAAGPSVPRPDPDALSDLELGHAGQGQHGVASCGVRGQLGVLDLVGAHGLLVGHAGDDTVGGLGVELHMVDVDVDLGEVVGGVGVGQLAGQGDRVALTDVGAQRQWLERLGAGQHRGFVMGQH